MAHQSRFGSRLWSLVAGVIGLAMIAVYITVILMEGDNSVADWFPWVLVMALSASGAISSAWIDDRRLAKGLIAGSAAVFTVLGLLSIFSIGLGFLLAASAGCVAAVQMSRSDRT